MNTGNEVLCPNCGQAIQLTQAVAEPLITEIRSKLNAQIEAERKARENAEESLAKERANLEAAKASVDAQIAEGIAAKRPDIEASIRKAVAAEMAAEVRSKEQENQVLRECLAEAQKAQLEALRAKQTADLKVASLDLEIQKQVSAQVADLREQAAKDAEEQFRLKLDEKDMLIKRLSEEAEGLRRKAEQGSQRDQGEVAEIELQHELTSAFPWDEIEEIRSGVRGADVLQRVKASVEAISGTILWERKRTQAWGGDWLAKARQDMRRESADAVVIVSEVLPKGVETFGCCDDVWVVVPSCAVPLAQALRSGILQTASARRAAEGRKTNAELAYDYLTGPDFVARLKGIAEPFVAMQKDLDGERRAMEKHWARRQKLIDAVRYAAFGMQGDIEGLTGLRIQELGADDLGELPALPEHDEGG